LNKEVPEEYKGPIVVPIYKKVDKTHCSNYIGISLLPSFFKVLTNNLLSRLTPYGEEIIGDNVNFDSTGQLLIMYSAFVKYLRKNGTTTKQYISALYISRKLMI